MWPGGYTWFLISTKFDPHFLSFILQGRARFRIDVQFMHTCFGKHLLYDADSFIMHELLSEVSWSWAHFIKCVWNSLCLEFELFEFCFPCRSKKYYGSLHPASGFTPIVWVSPCTSDRRMELDGVQSFCRPLAQKPGLIGTWDSPPSFVLSF